MSNISEQCSICGLTISIFHAIHTFPEPPKRLRSTRRQLRYNNNKKGRLLAQQGEEIQKLKKISEQLYEALKEVQGALFEGEDENIQQIEEALQAWERRNVGNK